MTDPAEPVRLIDVIERIAGSRGRVVRNHAILVAVAVGLSLIWPRTYTGRALVFPAMQSESTGLDGVLSSSAARKFLASISLEGAATPNTLLIGTLKSRAVGLAVIDSLKLVDHYGAKDRERAYLVLQRRLSPQETPEGFLEVRVDDRSPEMAARMTNASVTELERVSIERSRERAGEVRAFVEDRLALTRGMLEAGQESLRVFQERTGMVVLDEQARAAIDYAGKMMADRAALDVEIAFAQSYATERNPFIQELRTKRGEITRKLEELQVKLPGSIEEHALPRLAEFPGFVAQYARLLLDVKAQEETFLVLAAELEKARIDEARQTTSIVVLDEATPPIRPSHPKKKLLVASLLSASLFFHFIYYATVVALASSPQGERWWSVWRSLARRRAT